MNQNLKPNWMFGTSFTFSVIFHDESIFFINRIKIGSNIERSISVDIAVFRFKESVLMHYESGENRQF